MKKHFFYRKKVERYLDEKDFNSPILKENGITGGDTFAVETNSTDINHPPYYAFDNNSNTYWSASNKPSYLTFYNPKPLKVNKLEWDYGKWGYGGYNPAKLEIWVSNDNSSWELLTTKFTDDGKITVDLSDNEKFYNYYKINIFDNTASNTNINIIALRIFGIEKINKKYVANKTYAKLEYVPKFYKYQYQDFVPPKLTDYKDGDNFSVYWEGSGGYGDYAWKMFDGNPSTFGRGKNSSPPPIVIYNHYPLKITRLSVQNISDLRFGALVFRILGSNDGVNFTEVQTFTGIQQIRNYELVLNELNNKNYYKYYQFYLSNNFGICVQEITITGQERYSVPTSAEDYDYFINIPRVKLFNNNEEEEWN